MTEAEDTLSQMALPDHVDPAIVFSLDSYELPTKGVDPYEATRKILHERPRVFFTQSVTGSIVPQSWVVTRNEDIRRVLQDNETYSTTETAAFQKLLGESFDMIPLSINPPDHTKYRLFLNPWLVPKRLRKMEHQIQQIIGELIDDFADKGEVDLSFDFGRIYPVRVFLDMMGFPREMLEPFLEWGYASLHSQGDMEKIAWGWGSALNYLREFISEVRKKPNDALASYIVHGEIDGQRLTDDEIIGMIAFLWIGGLDTVAATSSLMFRRLAFQPELQNYIRNNPDCVPKAVDEFLRTQPIVTTTRRAIRDHEIHGIKIKAGDAVCPFTLSGNFDPEVFEDPAEFKIERKNRKHHTLGGGHHLCLGKHLAKMELGHALREILHRLPEFSFKPGADLMAYPGLIAAPHVEVTWA